MISMTGFLMMAECNLVILFMVLECAMVYDRNCGYIFLLPLLDAFRTINWKIIPIMQAYSS